MLAKWLMSTIALLVVDVRTGALLQATSEPHQCYSCTGNSTSPCDQPSKWSAIVCPTNLPFCATTASSPDFASSLSCAGAAVSPCSLQYTPRQTYQATCLCTGRLCNVPFSSKLRNELLNISYSQAAIHNDSAKLNELFHNLSMFANDSDSVVYKAITVEIAKGTEGPIIKSSELMTATSTPMALSTHSLEHSENAVPRAEALQQEATAPSDDDEDEAEGSGSYEERQPQPASAPAAPSSYLPAENTAPTLLSSFLTTTLVFILVVV